MLLFLLFGCQEPKIEFDTAQCETSVTDIAKGLTTEQYEVSETIEEELSQLDIPDNLIAAAIVNAVAQAKREETRKLERYQDQLKLELKDLKIQLYQLEKDLSDWKDKYYNAIQQLIEVRAELEETLVKLSIIHIEHENDLD
jgi:hypothetical protein